MNSDESITELSDRLLGSMETYSEATETLEKAAELCSERVESYKRGEVSHMDVKDGLRKYAAAKSNYIDAAASVEISAMEIRHKMREEEMWSSGDNEAEKYATEMEILTQKAEEMGVKEVEEFEGDMIVEVIPRLQENDNMEKDPLGESEKSVLESDYGYTMDDAWKDCKRRGMIDENRGLEASVRRDWVRENPSDSYIGYFESEEGTSDIEVVRERLKSREPRNSVEHSGPSEEELEQRRKRIEEARERVCERDPRGFQ